MANLYIGDWHYGHKNVIKYDNRPFFTQEEMNRALVDNWNAVVGENDTVYVVGDMFWCGTKEAVEVLERLAGTKVLIRGNHDYIHSPEFTSHFEAIADYLEIEDNGRGVVLCHYPIPCFKNHFRGWYHLYAHVHISFEANMMEHVRREMEELYEKPCRMYNVGAMMPYIDYAPRTLDHIIQGCDGVRAWK